MTMCVGKLVKVPWETRCWAPTQATSPTSQTASGWWAQQTIRTLRADELVVLLRIFRLPPPPGEIADGNPSLGYAIMLLTSDSLIVETNISHAAFKDYWKEATPR